MREEITSKALSLGGIFTVREAGNICSGGLKLALRANPAFTSLGGEPSIYLAWRVPNVNLAQKNPLPFLWGRGWGGG